MWTYRYAASLPDCNLYALRNITTTRKLPRPRVLIAWLAVRAGNTGRLDSGFPDQTHPAAGEELRLKACFADGHAVLEIRLLRTKKEPRYEYTA
jgi:hypothetical protein